MRYHYEPKTLYFGMYGTIYKCDHPVYNECTLYSDDGIGLAVIQQRYDPKTKATYWTSIDESLRDDLYLHPGFYDYYKKYAKHPENDIYPTVTIRQIMWALKMKPLKREKWETLFDHCPI